MSNLDSSSCRLVVASDEPLSGLALCSAMPLSLWGGLDPETGEVIDRRHPLSGQRITGRMLALPAGRGSSSASSVLLESVRLGTAPAALLLMEPDGILALGAVVAREIYGHGPAVAVLSRDVWETLTDGRIVGLSPRGELTLGGQEVEDLQ